MNEIVTNKKENISSMIYEIRGVLVILDSDLAKIFECKNGTKEINQAVKNNIDRFSESVSWKLSDNEIKDLWSKILTANIHSKSRTNPRVFTEQGVSILATIMKSKVTIDISLAITNAFKEKNNTLIKIEDSPEDIRNLIYEIRSKQVILDSDLARLYECTNGTKDVNKAVNRNIERFPSDFYFQLSKEEYDNLKFQNGTSSFNKYGGVRKMPFVFTEEGTAMLATVLKTEVATKMSVAIMRAFVAMRHYVSTTLLEQKYINNMVLEHDSKIKYLQKSFNKFEDNNKTNAIFFDGQIYDAYSLLLDILNTAKEEVIIIDNYAGKELLDILKEININIKIYSSNINEILIKKYKSQYNNIEFTLNNKFHDRFIIIDKTNTYHCGSSFKDLGKKCFAINRIEDNKILLEILKNLK